MLELLANMIYIEHILTKEGISMNNIKELYGEAIIDSRDSEELNIGERIKLEYYKTISKLFANGNRETYGIGIVKKYKDTKKEKIESKETKSYLNFSITSSFAFIAAFSISLRSCISLSLTDSLFTPII